MLTVADIQKAYRKFSIYTQQVGPNFIVFGPAAEIMRGKAICAEVISARVLPSVINRYKVLFPTHYIEPIDGEPYIDLPEYTLQLYSNEGKSTQWERIDGVYVYPLQVDDSKPNTVATDADEVSRIYKDFDLMLYTIGMIYHFVNGAYRAPNDECAEMMRDSLLRGSPIHDMRFYDKDVMLKLSYIPASDCYEVTIIGSLALVIDDYLKLLECDIRGYGISKRTH